ncbi:hypothetical protein CDD80_1752 [Ophiocordyceps camponoti-rufipedis]|uniref:SUR7 family protein FMP45 n=1 Tax=Ophiocordyceps camponoti-rufipedis TaxID=2004952 RepID=A0A2C5YDJ8_9HYPO|nr:hypothetical protein CDD80_1752 [Ophiocordyceps camponoti-rufipedis]
MAYQPDNTAQPDGDLAAHQPDNSRQHQTRSRRWLRRLKYTPLATIGIFWLLLGAILLWFIILSGVTRGTPLKHTYFLRADTSNITGAREITQWTYFLICGDKNRDCHAHGAQSFGRAWAPDAENVPPRLAGNWDQRASFHYFFMWRFGWVFLIFVFFFIHVALFSALIACCGRRGSIFTLLMCIITWFWYTLAVSIITAVFCQARSKFHQAGRKARIGSWAFGFLWGSYACVILACFFFLWASRAFKRKDKDHDDYRPAAGAIGAGAGSAGAAYWRRRSDSLPRRSHERDRDDRSLDTRDHHDRADDQSHHDCNPDEMSDSTTDHDMFQQRPRYKEIIA